MSRRIILSTALALSFGLVGCDDDGETPDPGETGGSGGEGGAGSVGCSTEGTGTVEIRVSGIPAALEGDVVLSGSDVREELALDTVFDDLPAGEYAVSAGTVLDDDPIVRTVYEPVVSEREFCLENGATQVVTVTYSALPSSNKLWTSSLVGFKSSALSASGDAEAIVVEASAGKDLAFDRSGNLWALGATVADPHVVRFPVAELGASGAKEWDRAFDVPAVACLPAIKALAFSGPDLWLSVCGDRLMKFTNGMFAASGELTPDLMLEGVVGNDEIATNAAGVWVATGTAIALYEGQGTGTSDEPAELTLTVRDAEDDRDLDPTGIAFDADGNLWGFGFGSNTVFKVAAAELEVRGEQTVVADVSFVIGVDVLVATGAFDNGGGLWLSYGSGRLGRLSPEQLGVSSGTGDPVMPERIVTNDVLNAGLNLALFANPPGVPLSPGYD